jgi:hypothetical protein
MALVRANVSEKHTSSIIKVIRISELGNTLPVTSNGSTLQRNADFFVPGNGPSSSILVTLMMELHIPPKH